MPELVNDPFKGLLARQQAAHDATKERMTAGIVWQDRDRALARLRRARRRMIRIRVALVAGKTAAALAIVTEDDADANQ